MGKRVIIFSLLVGNEGWEEWGRYQICLFLLPLPQQMELQLQRSSEELVILTICHQENSNDCGNPLFIWVGWLIGFRVLLHGFAQKHLTTCKGLVPVETRAWWLKDGLNILSGYSKSRAVIPKLDFLLLVSNLGHNIKQPVLFMCNFTWFYFNKLDLLLTFIL